MPEALATPQKRLFISLITRDISLADAVLDLLDNSINSAIADQHLGLVTPSDYISLLAKKKVANVPTVTITFDSKRFEMSDTAGGISLADAETKVFQFGRPPSESGEDDADDTLSVYGIGMKRALFKIGDRVRIESRHRSAGFTMDLRVRRWERLPQQTWTIPIEALPFNSAEGTGTKITITRLFDEISRRISDGTFEGELVRKIARTYSYFLEKVVRVSVNGVMVAPAPLAFGENVASDQFAMDGVSCSIISGIYVPEGKFYQADRAGWYIFCNGRAVAFADKTALTGWGILLQPFSQNTDRFLDSFLYGCRSENLPWTTTKAVSIRKAPSGNTLFVS